MAKLDEMSALLAPTMASYEDGGGATQLERRTRGTDDDTVARLVVAGEKALAVGTTAWSFLSRTSADRDPARALFMFRSDDLQELLSCLVVKWAGKSGYLAQMTPNDAGVPRWVATLRARALYFPVGEGSAREQRLTMAATQLCDLVARRSESEQFRERIARRADIHRGKKAISDAEFQEGRRLNPGFTSCIRYIARPLGGEVRLGGDEGPCYVREARRTGSGGFPAGTFHHVAGDLGRDRPKPGDLIVYRTTARMVGGQPVLGELEHISVFRRLGPGVSEGTETWITVDGGNEDPESTEAGPAREKALEVVTATGIAREGPRTRRIHGWIDTQRLFEIQEAEKAADEARRKPSGARAGPASPGG